MAIPRTDTQELKYTFLRHIHLKLSLAEKHKLNKLILDKAVDSKIIEKESVNLLLCFLKELFVKKNSLTQKQTVATIVTSILKSLVILVI